MDSMPYTTNGPSSTECLDAGLVCSIDPTTGQCTECGQEEFPSRYGWTDWQSEEEELGSDGRKGVYWIEIFDPQGEEYAVIVHRTVGGLFPLDGSVAKEKEARAQQIVDALNSLSA
jgi:hypothetical protein